MIPSYIHVGSKVSHGSILSDDEQSFKTSHRRMRLSAVRHFPQLPQDQSKWQGGEGNKEKMGDVPMKLPHRSSSQKSVFSAFSLETHEEEDEEEKEEEVTNDDIPQTVTFSIQLGSSISKHRQRLSLQEDSLPSYCSQNEEPDASNANDRPPRMPRRVSN